MLLLSVKKFKKVLVKSKSYVLLPKFDLAWPNPISIKVESETLKVDELLIIYFKYFGHYH